MEIIILVGLQASGKSTFYKTHFSTTHVHVSKDLLIRNKNKTKEQKQAERIETAFQELHSVVVDNTNATLQDRLPLIDVGRRYGATIVGYYFQPDVLGSRTRDMRRTGKAQVPEKAIFITAHKLVPPLPLMQKVLMRYTTCVSHNRTRHLPLAPPRPASS